MLSWEDLTEQEAAIVIVDHWTPHFMKMCGGTFPVDYTTFDTETSGFSPARDVIVEWGHCIVRDRKVVDQNSILINWFGSGLIDDTWLAQSLLRVQRHMADDGRNFAITEERLRDEGSSPEEILPWMHEFLMTLLDSDEILVCHNGWRFDVRMLESHFKGFMEEDFMRLRWVWPDFPILFVQ